MFDPKSRYLAAESYILTDRRGRQVNVVSAPSLAPGPSLGLYVLRQGERMDHLAAKYLSNPAGFWRIAAQNGVVIVEALTEQPEIDIPQP